MSTLQIVSGIVMLITSIAIVILVMLQEAPKQGGLSALTGGDSSFFSRNRGRTRDAMLSNATVVAGVVFFVVTIVVYAILARTAITF